MQTSRALCRNFQRQIARPGTSLLSQQPRFFNASTQVKRASQENKDKMVQDARIQRSSLNDSVRMFVCETDETEPETQERRGTFGDVFDDLFKKAGDNHDPPLGVETLMRHVVEPDGGRIPEFHEFDGIDAILITGSMYDAHGDDEWIHKFMALLKGRNRKKTISKVHPAC